MAEIIKNLNITSLVHGGRGIGRHEGKAVFVPLTMPGDRVSCQVVKSRRRFVEAELLEVVEPSSSRRQPPCPFFGSCGGCQWQHIPYVEQAYWKEKTFSDQLIRNKVVTEDRLKPIVSAPDEWRYRNRVQLKCHYGEDGLKVGYYQRGTHRVVDVDQCLLVSSHIQGAMDALRNELQDVPRPDCLQQIDVACGDDGKVRIVFHVTPQGRRRLGSWLLDFVSRHQFDGCIQSASNEAPEVIHGEGDLTVKVGQPEMTLRCGPGGFVQVNSEQNRNMIAGMLELLALDGREHVLDLFCGMGNFSLPLARKAGRVTGVESYSPSIEKGRSNASANQISNVEFHVADAATIMTRYLAAGHLDLVVLDPPRTGNFQAAKELLKASPARILYVSCDPATLVRDLVPLVQGGYKVVSSQPFDLFPQTWHIESMTLLEKL